MTLPDESFFTIMRNYLGELHTPFNKHRLYENIVSFIRKKATRERMVSLIDGKDAELLTAITILGEPDIENLVSFLAGSESYLELHHRLLNLEERLLIYREIDEEGGRIITNPLLERELSDGIVDAARIFPCVPVEPAGAAPPWLTEGLVLAFLSYLLKNGSFMKSDGSIRKKSRQDLERTFPVLFEAREEADRVVMLGRSLERLGIVTAGGNKYGIDPSSLRAFGATGYGDRQRMLWVAAAMSADDPGTLRQWADLLERLLESMNPRTGFPLSVIGRIMFVITGGSIIESSMQSERFVKTMKAMRVFLEPEPGLYSVNPPAVASFREPEQESVILQPNFELIVPRTVGIVRGAVIPFAADIVRHDIRSTYEISKESYLRAIRAGFEPDEIDSALRELTDRPLPQNVAISAAAWMREYRSIELRLGVVLSVDEERRLLVEHSGFKRQWVRQELAQGVYLLDPAEEALWRRDLERCGFDTIPPVRGPERPEGEPQAKPPSPRSTAFRNIPVISALDGKVERIENDARFIEEIIERASEYDGADREEILARVRKKLILFPEQLQSGLAPREKTEARGVDFLGKIRLIEQAIRSGSDLLEIIERSNTGEPVKILVKPVELERKGNELELVGIDLPGGAQQRVRVRKIALIRKLKDSLYAP